MFGAEHPFVKKVFLLLSIIILELAAQFYGIKWPFILLFGPILLYCKSSHKKKYNRWAPWFHSAPFILFLTGQYLIQHGWYIRDSVTNSWFMALLVPVQIVSLSVYGILSLVQKKQKQSGGQSIDILLSQLAYIDIAIAAGLFVLITARYLAWAFDVSPNSVIIIIFFFKIGLISRYLYQEWHWELEARGSHPELPSFVPGSRTTLPENLLRDYEGRLNQCLIENKLYLKSGLSLELLARETGIPKYHFSTLLNAHIGKSFYQLLAEHRINEAISLMQQEDNMLTIEGLAYECGFNSKSSFNKYFKEMIGCLPSEFSGNQLAK